MTIIISLLLLATLLPHLTFTDHVNVGIVDGREAVPHSRPYMVSIQVFREHICGGFLISDEFVLTAAHCQNGFPLTVVVGAHNLTVSQNSDRIRVISQIPHPRYIYIPDLSLIRNDIMLLKLENKVELNNTVRLIALPNEGEDVATDSVCSVAGWGYLAFDGTVTDVLMEANTTTINQTECQLSWGMIYSARQMICAHGGGGSCRGDSGGPLVCGNTAVGVTSFVKTGHCNAPDRPNVYTKISAYIQWINQVTGNFK